MPEREAFLQRRSLNQELHLPIFVILDLWPLIFWRSYIIFAYGNYKLIDLVRFQPVAQLVRAASFHFLPLFFTAFLRFPSSHSPILFRPPLKKRSYLGFSACYNISATYNLTVTFPLFFIIIILSMIYKVKIGVVDLFCFSIQDLQLVSNSAA